MPPRPPPHMNVAGGDWHCPACNNWNFSRRNECNRCGARHPTRKEPKLNARDVALDRAAGLDTAGKYSTSYGSRTGEAGGFREFDDTEEERRKQRALVDKVTTEARKAEKQKCKWCHRAACIC